MGFRRLDHDFRPSSPEAPARAEPGRRSDGFVRDRANARGGAPETRQAPNLPVTYFDLDGCAIARRARRSGLPGPARSSPSCLARLALPLLPSSERLEGCSDAGPAAVRTRGMRNHSNATTRVTKLGVPDVPAAMIAENQSANLRRQDQPTRNRKQRGAQTRSVNGGAEPSPKRSASH